ncbi:MAG: DUF2497 domain-containing protein [Alphaproteobacteria bacterium]|nr:DUF2497 domain-containing protein [Alphaproteobacteria bacterium]
MTAEKPTTEPSMDDILASIRQIISGDTKSDSPHHKRDEDVLDLTEVIQEEDQHKLNLPLEMNRKSEEIPSQNEAPKSPYGPSADHTHRVHLDPKRNDIETLAADLEKEDLFSLIKSTQDIKTVTSHEDLTPPSQAIVEDTLLSKTTFSETLEALSPLTTLNDEGSHQYGRHLTTGINSKTIEDLVREALKPLLKEWLDTNLPSLVRQIVSEQVANIVQQLSVKKQVVSSEKPKNTPSY